MTHLKPNLKLLSPEPKVFDCVAWRLKIEDFCRVCYANLQTNIRTWLQADLALGIHGWGHGRLSGQSSWPRISMSLSMDAQSQSCSKPGLEIGLKIGGTHPVDILNLQSSKHPTWTISAKAHFFKSGFSWVIWPIPYNIMSWAWDRNRDVYIYI